MKWETNLSEFMVKFNQVKDIAWWCCDTDLKYLEIRIDTRDNGFLLYAASGNGERELVSQKRVYKAIESYLDRFPHLKHKKGPHSIKE